MERTLQLTFHGKNLNFVESEFSWKGLIFAERVQFSRKEFNFRGKSSNSPGRSLISCKRYLKVHRWVEIWKYGLNTSGAVDN